MKKETRKTLLALAVLAAAAAVLLVVYRTLTPKGTAGDKTITVQVVHKDGSTKDFTLKTAEAYLGPAMVEGNVVVNDQGAYGLYIRTADGETADEGTQEWRKVTKGGERVDTGADTTPIADGDRFELTLTVGYDG